MSNERIAIDRTFWMWVIGGALIAFFTGAIYAHYLGAFAGWEAGFPWEIAVLRTVHTPLPAVLDRMILLLPWLGTNLTIIPGVAFAMYMLAKRDRSDLIITVISAAAGNYIIGFTLKFAFDRPRPELWPGRGEHTGPSYPSGHAMMATSVLFVVAYLLRRERGWRWPFVANLIFGLLTIYSRLYLGVHWPTDVLAGVLIGGIWLAAMLRAIDAGTDDLFDFEQYVPASTGTTRQASAQVTD